MAKKPEISDKFTVRDFFNKFPDEDACLDHVLAVRFGQKHKCRKCGVESTFHKIAGRKAYECSRCRDHLYPCAGTIFQDSRTPLQSWFYAIFLFVTTRHGVSGKELQRTLGVTYKCGWRMGQQIRLLMEKAEGFKMLQGHVELDEAYIGGKKSGIIGQQGNHGKTIVMGLVERGGPIVTRVIPYAQKVYLQRVVHEVVKRGSTVSTDELPAYSLLNKDGYNHGAVKHSAKEYVRQDDDTLHHTNSVEGFWRLFKNSVRSTHIHVSPKYMQRYLNEFTFRSNHRKMQNAMFDLLIGAL